MKNNNKFYEPNMKNVEINTRKSISDRLDKMESMLLYGIDKMEIIDKKLDEILDKNSNKASGDDIFKK